MDKHLIIDVRRNLPLRRRMGSDLATAAVWGGWVMLVFNSFPGAAHARPALAHAAAARLPALTINPLWLLAGFVVAVLWTAPRLFRPAKPSAPAPDYASHFGISEPELVTGRAAQVCTVHHDDHGRIVAIDTDAPKPPGVTDADPELPRAA